MHHCADLRGPRSDLIPQKPSGSSASAIPTGSIGILITCESNYEFKAAKEAVALVEEVRIYGFN